MKRILIILMGLLIIGCLIFTDQGWTQRDPRRFRERDGSGGPSQEAIDRDRQRQEIEDRLEKQENELRRLKEEIEFERRDRQIRERRWPYPEGAK